MSQNEGTQTVHVSLQSEESHGGDATLAGYMQELGASLTLVETDDISDLKFVDTSDGEYLDDMVAGEPDVDASAVAAAIVASAECDNAPDFVKNERVATRLYAGEPLSVWRETAVGLRLLGEPDDREFVDTKLRGYTEVTDLKSLYPGDHLRITQNKYRQAGRKCSYIVLKRYDAEAGIWWVNGFKSSYPDWKISVRPLNRYKQVRFYRRIPTPHTGACSVCSRNVKSPYMTCFTCRQR